MNTCQTLEKELLNYCEEYIPLFLEYIHNVDGTLFYFSRMFNILDQCETELNKHNSESIILPKFLEYIKYNKNKYVKDFEALFLFREKLFNNVQKIKLKEEQKETKKRITRKRKAKDFDVCELKNCTQNKKNRFEDNNDEDNLIVSGSDNIINVDDKIIKNIISKSVNNKRTGIFYVNPNVSVEIPKCLFPLMSKKYAESNLSKLFKMGILVFRLFEQQDKFVELFQKVLYKKQMEIKGDKNKLKKVQDEKRTSLNDKYSFLKIDKKFLEKFSNSFSETDFGWEDNILVSNLEKMLNFKHGTVEIIINAFLSTNYEMTLPTFKNYRAFIITGSGITDRKLLIFLQFLLESLLLLYRNSLHFSLPNEEYAKMLDLIFSNEKYHEKQVVDKIFSQEIINKCDCGCHIKIINPTITQSDIDNQNKIFDELPNLTIQFKKKRENGKCDKTNFIMSYFTHLNDNFGNIDNETLILNDFKNAIFPRSSFEDDENNVREICKNHIAFLKACRVNDDWYSNSCFNRERNKKKKIIKTRLISNKYKNNTKTNPKKKCGSQIVGKHNKIFKFYSKKAPIINIYIISQTDFEFETKASLNLFLSINKHNKKSLEFCQLVASDHHLSNISIKSPNI